ncbi:mycothiol synthase [Glycomyces terrestris]|uniref:Mycothiol acetyltransferase n=1 Tax=Glycomyces terrestris TaxID=2493553 RepID=A0A426UXW9_9ACTN|nr:mycothiol synthase [Glycomyces terrestris]RRR99413.1 mycothiol synthase [Glycomyces terrestris]
MAQHASLPGRDIHRIVTMAGRCEAVDGIAPFNEQTTLAMSKHPDKHRRHFVVPLNDSVIAYAGAEVVGDVAEAELAVDPDHRNRGVGGRLLDGVLDWIGPVARELRVWAHGDLPAAQRFAAAHGFDRARVLYQFSRELTGFPWPAAWPEGASRNWPTGDAAAATLADGVRLRPFRTGRDEAEWLRVNAAAFADHPEQGRWTAADLRARQEESWFDPDGLLVAEDADGMLGFHWTKVEGGVGEVYVLGVDPRAQGTGLGRTLTLAGLAHLAAHGIRQVDLYADESNTKAVALYRKQGFEVVRTDVQWSRRLR